MSYDDIRGSWWDDDDDDDAVPNENAPQGAEPEDPEEARGYFFGDSWIDDYDEAFEFEPSENECVMCGKERPLNIEGYCNQCWQIWNS